MRTRTLPLTVVGLTAAFLAFLSVAPNPGYSADDYSIGYQQGSQDGEAATLQGATVQTQGTATSSDDEEDDDEEDDSGCS